MAKTKQKTRFECQACGLEVPQYLGRCPQCEAWNSFEEVKLSPLESSGELPVGRRGLSGVTPAVPQRLSDITLDDQTERYTSGYAELDRVLGGGLLPGGYFLIGGDPGIGKSTLMLQVADKVSAAGKTVLYVAGEESAHQIKMRAGRLGVTGDRVLIFPETHLLQVMEEIKTSRPDLVVIDSIQSLYHPDVSGTPGSVSQIKECATELMSLAKALNVTILLVGHVTKEGSVSGPRLLEHMVDGVLYFEGDKFRTLRIVRSVKNRFGSTNEIGIFEMQAEGLVEVDNPSAAFLSEHACENQPGSVILVTMEGNRPILVELQALVGLTTYAAPRRIANGVDVSRVHQIVAVLERRLGLDFSKQDIYVNVVGGLKIQETAADLAVALALVTSSHGACMKTGTVIAGELGLTGEIRPISHYDARVTEAQKLGFKRLILPQRQSSPLSSSLQDVELIGVSSFMDALHAGLDPQASIAEDKSNSIPAPF